MGFFKKKTASISSAVSAGIQPCETGQAVLSKANPTVLNDIRALVSVPAELFNELYGETLYRLAAYCQALPLLGEDKLYGLLNSRLTYAIDTLKIRRGRILPLNTDAEIVAQQEPRWTYAVFTAALFFNAYALQPTKRLVLVNPDGTLLHEVHPLAGGLAEPNTFYRVMDENNPLVLEVNEFIALLIQQIIPIKTRRWLTQEPMVCLTWYYALQGELMDNCISDLLGEAITPADAPASKITDPVDATLNAANQVLDTGKDFMTLQKEEPVNTLPRAAMDADSVAPFFEKDTMAVLEVLLDKLSSLPIKNAESEPPYLKLKQGLFVNSKTLAALEANDAGNLPADLIGFLKPVLIEKEGNALHCFQPADFMDKRVLSGIVLNPDELSLQWKEPVDTDFVSLLPL
jgi:hypothetical protein